MAAFPYQPHFPLPHGVAHIRPSSAPLPMPPPLESADSDVATVAEALDRRTPAAERNTVQRGFDTPVLFGALTVARDPRAAKGRRLHNSALLVGSDGEVLGQYDKVYLLMFGEYIPFLHHFGAATQEKVRNLIPEAGDFTAGRRVEPLPFGSYRLGVLICYEDILAGFTRKVTGKRPHVLVNLTNDAWFGQTSEPYLHLALATFRTIENRLAMVRSTNTGVSAFIDPVGRIVAQTSLSDPETLIWDVPMLQEDTFYRRFGDLVGYASLAWLLLLTVAAVGFKPRPRR